MTICSTRKCVAEHKRSGKSGHPDSAGFRDHGPGFASCRSSPIIWGPRWLTLRDHGLAPELLQAIPANTARMYQCVPVGLDGLSVAGGVCRSAQPGAGGRAGFYRQEGHPARSWPIPSEIQQAIDKYYGDRTSERCCRDSQGTWVRTRILPRKSSEARPTDDAGDHGGPGQRRADRPVCEPGPLPGGAGPRERHPLRAVRRRIQHPLPRGRRAVRNVAAAQAPGACR